MAKKRKRSRSKPPVTFTSACDQVEAILHAMRALELLGEAARPVAPAIRRALYRAREREATQKNPCWMFVRFSAEATIESLAAARHEE